MITATAKTAQRPQEWDQWGQMGLRQLQPVANYVFSVFVFRVRAHQRRTYKNKAKEPRPRTGFRADPV
jgi:hypothetical protein